MPAETLKLGGLASEPGAAGQWHLRNTGQAAGTPGIDINVLRAWADSTGLGVRIGIIDDGFDLTHPDLAANFRGGWDSRGNDPVPQAEADDIHGTATAGLIGADDNGGGLLGVAHDATLLGFRIGFGAAGTGAQVIDALSRQAGVIRKQTLILNLPGQPKAIKETLDGVFAAVPYCIDLIGGPYIETHENVIKVFRPKSAIRPKTN